MNQVQAQQQAIADSIAAQALADSIAGKKFVNINTSILVHCLKKSFIPSDIYNGRLQDLLCFKFELENESESEIRAFKGTFVFKNLFGDELKSYNIVYDEIPIPSHSKKTITLYYEYNQLNNDSYSGYDSKVRTTELKNLKCFWEVKSILFSDGREMKQNE